MIKTYRKGEHKGGFIGVRVAVMVDSKLIQKYFSFKSSEESEDKILTKAKQLHAQLLMEKNLALSKREIATKETRRVTSPFSTGVKGIKFRIEHNSCYFYVQGQTEDVRFQRNFNINKLGYDLAWFKACEYLQENKNYALFDSIYKKKPAIERLFIVFRHLYFKKNSKVNFKALSSIINQTTLVSWLKQLLIQHENNKQFKAAVLEFMIENKIKDSKLLSLT